MSSMPIIQFLERFLNVTSDRQSLVINNMANIDTPMAPVAHKVAGLLQRPDGNDVSMDREGLLLAETQMQFRIGVQFIRSEFHRLVMAINEGKDS